MDTNACECEDEYIEDGSRCVGMFFIDFYMICPHIHSNIISSLECTYDSHCTEPNKGICRKGTCNCEEGYVENDSNCIGELSHV